MLIRLGQRPGPGQVADILPVERLVEAVINEEVRSVVRSHRARDDEQQDDDPKPCVGAAPAPVCLGTLQPASCSRFTASTPRRIAQERARSQARKGRGLLEDACQPDTRRTSSGSVRLRPAKERRHGLAKLRPVEVDRNDVRGSLEHEAFDPLARDPRHDRLEVCGVGRLVEGPVHH